VTYKRLKINQKKGLFRESKANHFFDKKQPVDYRLDEAIL